MDIKGKNKTRAAQKNKLFLTFFFHLKNLFIFYRFLNIVCLDQIQKSHLFYKKKLQSLN